MFSSKIRNYLLVVSASLALIGCGGDGNSVNDILPAQYEVRVTNLTNFQPISPVGLTLHEKGQKFFTIGQASSLDLEKLAEGGDNSGLLGQGRTSASTSGPVLPGETAVLTIRKEFGVFELSVFGMLVNTNDAFTGLNSVSIENMQVGDIKTMTTNAYDAGTEANSEAPGTIPGPADGGEGFNGERDDVNVVRMHSGVVTKDDGLSTSVLTSQEKFDNPVMKVVIKRIK
ncbi:MAG: hypothetical protein COA44_06440 [Arcobacter sp.]|nr:MAG: hypothetical protein COA44_06440 [Arcobacter sp.]